jgi:hypothetical protein
MGNGKMMVARNWRLKKREERVRKIKNKGKVGSLYHPLIENKNANSTIKATVWREIFALTVMIFSLTQQK